MANKEGSDRRKLFDTEKKVSSANLSVSYAELVLSARGPDFAKQ